LAIIPTSNLSALAEMEDSLLYAQANLSTLAYYKATFLIEYTKVVAPAAGMPLFAHRNSSIEELLASLALLNPEFGKKLAKCVQCCLLKL
jgi:hypothetical protein